MVLPLTAVLTSTNDIWRIPSTFPSWSVCGDAWNTRNLFSSHVRRPSPHFDACQTNMFILSQEAWISSRNQREINDFSGK